MTPGVPAAAALPGEDVLGLASAAIDLDRAPFTFPGSRLVVQRADGDVALRVALAEYERRLDDCVAIDRLVVRSERGALPVERIAVDRLGYDGLELGFDGPDALVALASAPRELVLHTGGEVRRTSLAAGEGVRIAVGADRSVQCGIVDANAALRRSSDHWLAWFARCPRVRPELQAMAAQCWWVLGANIVTLRGREDARAVVPSKIGYVGLWQWDAYFIAVGLRHGDPALAVEQLALALRFAGSDGQLPDVVHDEGVLASSDDLPESDRANLRRAGSAVADPDVPVPLTKPPLAAWAIERVLEATDAAGMEADWARALLPAVRASQRWWLESCDTDGDGLPEYGHPYSSGLDDCPAFDGELPVATPDLLAYLVMQDDTLARLCARFGDAESARAHRESAAAGLDRLLRLWRPDAQRFAPRGPQGWVTAHTIVDLLPLLTDRLPQAIARALAADLRDPATFAAPWPVPTVALDDPSLQPDRMWRGPVWVNTNALVIEGLRTHGELGLADELARRTLALVVGDGGPHEHWHPVSGRRARSATTSFGWSAALFLDLAVRSRD